MGREIRRVPADWEHPKYTSDTARHSNHVGQYKPLYDEDFDHALNEWLREYRLWKKGKHPDQKDQKIRRDYPNYWDWTSGPPDPEYYRPKWSKAERTHLQMYETTSEGTPISPVCATPEECARWLADNKASAFGNSTATYEQWLATCKAGWAPSMIAGGGKGLRSGVEASTD